jgi:flavin reductase (DIM6/NTAB) family NADH-FMN oxidoreductase RutF
MQATGEYTINFVHTTFMKEAHLTPIKAEDNVSEFELNGLTPEHIADFKAPFSNPALRIAKRYLQAKKHHE